MAKKDAFTRAMNAREAASSASIDAIERGRLTSVAELAAAEASDAGAAAGKLKVGPG